MKKTAVLMTVLAALAGLCMGCSKTEETKAEVPTAPKAENWEPETVAAPEAQPPASGHTHGGPGGHSH